MISEKCSGEFLSGAKKYTRIKKESSSGMFTDDITCRKVLKKSMNHQKAICPLSERFTEISLEKYSKSEIELLSISSILEY